MFIWHNIDVV